jgi:Gram-negative bacterial TonB protein C-terminal
LIRVSLHSIPTLRVGRVLVAILAMSIGGAARLQEPSSGNLTRGIGLLETGDAISSAKLLQSITKKEKGNMVAWHWLGVAFERQGKTGDARKAHEKAARLGDNLLMREIETAGLDNWIQAVERLKPQIKLAADSADSYIKLSGKLSRSKAQEWTDRSEFLHDYEQFPKVSGLIIYKGKDVTTKARVLEKPEPAYTEEARDHQVTGTVVLRAIFAADGKVRAIVPVVRLPHGLTGCAIRAARKIRFIPATKEGKPVSMWMELQYNFNLY